MSSQTVLIPPHPDVVVDASVSSSSSSLWDRLSNWASENKAVVYTAGAVVLVVTGAGVAYYLTKPAQPIAGAERDVEALEEKKRAKKEKRKAKKQVEDAKTTEAAPKTDNEPGQRCKVSWAWGKLFCADLFMLQKSPLRSLSLPPRPRTTYPTWMRAQ
jgi:import receptor subunit TOM70